MFTLGLAGEVVEFDLRLRQLFLPGPLILERFEDL